MRYISSLFLCLLGLGALALVWEHETVYQLKLFGGWNSFLLSERIFLWLALGAIGGFLIQPFVRGTQWWIVLIFWLTLWPTQMGHHAVWYVMFGGIGIGLLFKGLKPLTGRRDRLIGNRLRSLPKLQSLPRGVFLALLFVIPLTTMIVSSNVLFDLQPEVGDSKCYSYHAKVVAGGDWIGTEKPASFINLCLRRIEGGGIVSQYPPGHILALAVGHTFGVPWIINPLLVALSIVLIYLLGAAVFGERIGRLAGILSVLSPFVILMGTEFMHHSTALFGTMLFLYGMGRVIKREGFVFGVIAGTGLGVLLLTRPLSAVGIAVPAALYGLYLLRRDWRAYLPSLGTTGLLTIGATLFLGYFNLETNGDVWLTGYEATQGASHNPGFHVDPYGRPHTPLRGIEQVGSYVNVLHQWLFQGPFPMMLFMAAGFLVVDPKYRFWKMGLLVSFVSLLVAYVFAWNGDFFFGPRYLFEGVGIVLILIAYGIDRVRPPALFWTVSIAVWLMFVIFQQGSQLMEYTQFPEMWIKS